MSSILDKPEFVLKLNRNWQAIGWLTPRKALIAMCGGMDGGSPPMLALDIIVDEDGELVSAIPSKWEEWIKLPVRETDSVLTTKTGSFRCPRVIIAPVYAGMPTKRPSFNSDAIWRRDGGICQVSKRKLARSEGNMGHIKARALGGTRTFDNIVLMDSKLNTLQGTKTPEEAFGITLEPKSPLPVPAAYLIDEARFLEQKPFILTKK